MATNARMPGSPKALSVGCRKTPSRKSHSKKRTDRSGDFAAIQKLRSPCACRKCRNHNARWPSYYVGSQSRLSYECFEEARAPKDGRRYDGNTPGYVSTSSSPSAFITERARVMGAKAARFETPLAMDDESEAILKKYAFSPKAAEMARKQIETQYQPHAQA